MTIFIDILKELILGSIIDKIPNIDHAPIKINSLLIENPFSTVNEFTNKIYSYFTSQLIREVKIYFFPKNKFFSLIKFWVLSIF